MRFQLNKFQLKYIKLLNFLSKLFPKNIDTIFSEYDTYIDITNEKNSMNTEVLKDVLPEKVFAELSSTIDKYNINTPLRLSHFLAQCAHESGNWRFTVENLNYSKEALMSVFRRHFPTEAIAAQYARKPEKIANRAYANRMLNGDEDSGDGWKFRGRGYIQLTGRQNYSYFNAHVEDDIIQNPDLVAEKYPLLSAGWFWHENNLNSVADSGAENENVTSVTRRVNGGTNGLADRLMKFKEYYKLLNS